MSDGARFGQKPARPSKADERRAYADATERDDNRCVKCGAHGIERDHRKNRSFEQKSDRIKAARNRVVEHTPGPNPEIGTSDWRADMDSIRECSLDECTRAHYGLGYCRLHWGRFSKHGDPLAARTLFGVSVEDRLAAYSRPDGECLVWTRYCNKGGYGQIQINGRSWMAHRAAYEVAHGPIPAGKIVRHSCDNPPCVNPEHLLVGTTADNNRDKAERGRAPVAGAAKASRDARLARLAMIQ